MNIQEWGMMPDCDFENEVGLIPHFLDVTSPRSAIEQFADNYQGGWSPLPGFTWDKKTGALSYPGDPPMMPRAWTKFRDEVIIVYPYGWVLVTDANGFSFECSRMD